jgi:hypothetical protein
VEQKHKIGRECYSVCTSNGVAYSMWRVIEYASVLHRRYAERKGFKFTVIDETPADFGLKSVEIEITGERVECLHTYSTIRCGMQDRTHTGT